MIDRFSNDGKGLWVAHADSCCENLEKQMIRQIVELSRTKSMTWCLMPHWGQFAVLWQDHNCRYQTQVVISIQSWMDSWNEIADAEVSDTEAEKLFEHLDKRIISKVKLGIIDPLIQKGYTLSYQEG